MSGIATETLSEFLKARLAEERLGWRTQQWQENEEIVEPVYHFGRRLTDFLLEDIESKLAIVDLHATLSDYCNECGGNYPCATLRLLAAQFHLHKDFREEWA